MKILTQSELEHKLDILTFMTWFEPEEEGCVGYYKAKKIQCERILQKKADKRNKVIAQYRELLKDTIGGYTHYD
jgi:hypothetical protein